jgi:hypothetical protein
MHVSARSDALCGLSVVFCLAVGALGIGCARLGSLPNAPAGIELEPTGPEQTAIEQREICVGSKVSSVGKLGDVLYYRAAIMPDGKLNVGYFAFFSEERPWGNNWLTWSVVPALAVDMAYTRTVFTGPGLQRALSGKGDVEGFRIVYAVAEDGTLAVEHAVADDGSHDLVHLDASDVLAIDARRPTFYSDVWSHQLGARGARSMADLSYVTCYGTGHILPLPDSVDADYELRGRAPPAHVEVLGGRLIGAPDQRSASTSMAGMNTIAAVRQVISPSTATTPNRNSARFSATSSDE